MRKAFSFQQRLRVYMRDLFTCQYCGLAMNPLSPQLSLDHRYPEGDNTDENLATACKSCNSSKNRRTVESWRAGRPLLRLARRPYGLAAIISLVAEEEGLTVEQMLGPGRQQGVVEARRRAAWAMRNEGYTVVAIAEALRRRDHSTVVHLLKKQPRQFFTPIHGDKKVTERGAL